MPNYPLSWAPGLRFGHGQNIWEQGAYWQTQGYGTTGWPSCGEIDVMEQFK